MQIILLSGGSGKRLWPLSNEIRAKQFIKIFAGEAGHESMLQRVLRQDVLRTVRFRRVQQIHAELLFLARTTLEVQGFRAVEFAPDPGKHAM